MTKTLTKIITTFTALLVVAGLAQADIVKSKLDNGLTVTADYYEGDDAGGTAFIVMHGTWAHHTMELPTYLTELIAWEGNTVLNISLSLGISEREGFLDCATQPVLGAQQDAVSELSHWFDWLKDQGYSDIVLIAHSRGGAQSALFAQLTEHPMLKQLALIAPASWDKKSAAKDYQKNHGVKLKSVIKQFSKLDDTDTLDDIGVLYCESGTVDKRTFLSYYTDQPEKNTTTLLTQIDVPTVVYLGSEDPISLEFADQQDDLADEDHVEVVMINGADHFFRDLYADDIVDHLFGVLE